MFSETALAAEKRETLRCPRVQFGVDEHDPIHHKLRQTSAHKNAEDQAVGRIEEFAVIILLVRPWSNRSICCVGPPYHCTIYSRNA